MPFPSDIHRTLVTDPVDEDIALNNNWDKIDAGFTSLYNPVAGTTPVGNVVGPTVGTEWVNRDGTLYVYNGTDWVSAPQETWGVWTNLAITAPYVPRTGFGAQIRVSNFKNVEMRGGVQNTAAGNPFPDTGYVTINQNQFNTLRIPEMQEVFPSATSPLSVTPGQWAGAYLSLTNSGGFLLVRAIWEGTRPASGGSLSLDQVRYKAA